MQAMISIRNIVKQYAGYRALSDVSLEVDTGTVFGLLGPNGAGKTTTLRVLLGMLRATAGAVQLLGGDPWRDAVTLHKRLAYVPGDVALWPQLTGGEAIDVLCALQGSTNLARRQQLIQRFELDVRKRSHTYSKGNRQKVALVAALASDAELLLLDEPTSGLDPLMEVVFRECVHEAHARGCTVLLSSHILSEVEALCDRVTIVRAGKRVVHGSLADMRALATSRVVATLVPCDMSDITGVSDVQWQGETVQCQVTAAGMPALLGVLASHGAQQVTIQPPSLEEMFLQHYHTSEVPA